MLGKHAVQRTEVHQYLRADPSKWENAILHGQLVPINIRLVFLCPALTFIAVQTCFGISAEFNNDQRLVVSDIPISNVRSFEMLLIPADVFISHDNILRVAERPSARLSNAAVIKRVESSEQARASSVSMKGVRLFIIWRRVGHGPPVDGGVIMQRIDLFIPLLLALHDTFGLSNYNAQ